MKNIHLWLMIPLLAGIISCKGPGRSDALTRNQLHDKIAGGWAGKMIGVTYGAPTEFRAQGIPYTDSIKWVPGDIKGSLWQDDLYVQLTFLMTMDQYGMNAPARRFQEEFARAGYPLWHANVQARKNYYDSIFPPESGNPKYNIHADDIDFQIEADYIGFMCPGMPRQIQDFCNKIGHIMNYGDGVYGGIFISSLYAEAFLNNNISEIVQSALKAIPAESDYARIIRDVIALHAHDPSDWMSAWKELENKWGNVDICGAGSSFNIDAKLNGAFVVLGLLYGNGDPMRTLEITTRCGQDSDCNPSNAMAVLGVIKGFSNLPAPMKAGISAIGDSLFINTSYSFNKAVQASYTYALNFIMRNGGEIKGNQIRIKKQEPAVLTPEVSFPDVVFDREISVFGNKEWKVEGDWRTLNRKEENNPPVPQSRFSGIAGDAMEISFEGTGVSLVGNWVRDGGQADVWLDGKPDRSIDTYFFWNGQEHQDMDLWHIFGMPPGKHTVRVVVKGSKRPESEGTHVYISKILVFRTAPKSDEQAKLSFEQ